MAYVAFENWKGYDNGQVLSWLRSPKKKVLMAVNLSSRGILDMAFVFHLWYSFYNCYARDTILTSYYNIIVRFE